MIDHTAIQPGTWHHGQAVRTLTCIFAPVKSGGELRHSPGLPEGYSAPGSTPAHTAIAAGKVVVSSTRDRQRHLQASSSGEPCRPRMPVSDRQRHLRASSSGEPCRLRMLVSDRLSPVLFVRAGNLPEHPQVPLVVTGELMRPRRRVIAARPAVKARKGYALPLPRPVVAEFQ